MALVLNGLMFNLSWFLIVTSGNALVAWSVALVHVVLHLALLGRGRGETQLLVAATLYGLLLDQLLFLTGTLRAPGPGAPLWLSALWPVFACTLLHAFSGLRTRPLLAALAGAVGGYGSYRLGAGLSVVEFGSPGAGLVVALLWAGLFPLGLIVAHQYISGHAGRVQGLESVS